MVPLAVLILILVRIRGIDFSNLTKLGLCKYAGMPVSVKIHILCMSSSYTTTTDNASYISYLKRMLDNYLSLSQSCLPQASYPSPNVKLKQIFF